MPAAVFREQEDAAGYLELLYRLVTTVGVPEAVDHDRHTIFVRPAQDPETLAEHLTGAREPTQVGRACQELGIASLTAHSPQAKGRIERLFGTLQDRLVAELRLAGAGTLPEANAVLAASLSRFNARFGVPAISAEPAWRPLPAGANPWQIGCFRSARVVSRDETVRIGEHRLQLLAPRGSGSLARHRVEVREHLDGSLSVWRQAQRLAAQAAPAEAPVLRARSGQSPRVTDASMPAPVTRVDGGFAALEDADRAALSDLLTPPPAPRPRRPTIPGGVAINRGDSFSAQVR